MKRTLFLCLLSLSVSAIADHVVYSGNDNGEACELRLDIENQYASLDDCGVVARNFEMTDKKITIEGGADFSDCKIEVKLDDNKIPVKATLKTRHLLRPFYLLNAECRDLKQVN